MRDAFQHRHVIEHVVGRDAWVDAEILRQIAQAPAQRIRLGDDVDAVEADRPAGRRLQCCDRAHQGRLAGAVRPEQPEHAAADLEADPIERADAIGICVDQIDDRQHVQLPSRSQIHNRAAGRQASRPSPLANAGTSTREQSAASCTIVQDGSDQVC